jgi:hypothetical protein
MIPLAQVPVIGRTDLEIAPRESDRRPGPVAGDVLTSERSARADVYEISIVPADSRAVVSRYSEAIETVRALAQELRVDGWFTSDQTHYARVASYRSSLVR